MEWDCGQPQSYCPFGCPGARLLKSHASRWIPILAGFTRRFASHEDTPVLDTRLSEDGHSIRRRRRCGNCDKRFTTYERIELTMPVIVKKNGSRTDFDPAKLRGSLMLALRKRPVSAEAVDMAIQSIQDKLLQSGEREVMSGQVGELVMRELKRLDKIAYIRFASVYKSFEDVTEFQDVIDEVGLERKGAKKRES